MSFLAPYMLWGAVAASIPIVLHFFYRSRYRKLPWAAMKFLLASVEQTSRRLRFQELLLLLVRIALLVLLAIALARPSSTAGRGSARGDAVDAVLVIDTSFSMDVREGPKSRLEQAKTAARAVIDQLPAHSTVQIFACSDRSAALGPMAPSNLDQAKQIVDDLQVTHQATDFLPGLKEAVEALKRGHAPNKELYLFSDMHKLGWDQQAKAVIDTLQEVGKQATIYLVRCGGREPKNLALVDIVPQSGIPHTGERASFAVMIRNTGKEKIDKLQVTVSVAGSKNKETQPIPPIDPGGSRAVPVTVKLDKVGLQILTAEVHGDELPADNRIDRIIHVRDQVRVLVVDGAPDDREPEKSAGFFLMHALAPVREGERPRYHVQPKSVPAGQAAAAMLASQNICIFANVAVQPGGPRKADAVSSDFVRQLATFVREGHGLVIFAGDNVNVDAYNRILHDRHQLLPMKLTGILDVPADKQLVLARSTFSSPFFSKLRDDEHYQGMNKVELMKLLLVGEKPGKDNDGVSVLLRCSNGKPAMVSRKLGAGEVILVASSADLRWSPTWMLLYGVPFLDMTMNHLLQNQSQNHNGQAGEPLRWQPPESESGRAFAVFGPDGRRVRLGQPVIDKGRATITVRDTPLAGVYRIVPADEAGDTPTGVPFALSPDLRESENLETLTDGEIDRRLGIPVIHLTAGGDLAVFSGTERLKREWTLWLLLAVLGAALVETVLAWLCGRAW